MKRSNILRDALYNCDISNIRNQRDRDYAKGIYVGIVSALMAYTGKDYDHVIEIVKANLPDNFDYSILPLLNWD